MFFSVGHRRSEWSQSFCYDPFGNIKKTNNGGATAYSANYSTATNQVSSGITPAPLYDQNGNQKNLTASSGSLTWNALNQPITFNASTSATYDALGRMVETYNSSSGVAQQFVFRPSGAMLAVYNAGTGTLVKGTIPLPGGETAIYNSGGLSYIRHTDWLGSSRFSTTWAHAVYAKESYAPFGETYNEAGTADRSFTGQDQDVVTGSGGTGVYDFLYRKHDPSAGRWLSPDPSGWSAADISNPQSLNRYAYALNNPLSLIDLTGLDACAYDQGDGTALVYQSSNPQWQGDCPGDGIYIESDQSISSIGFDGYVWQGYDDDIVVGQSNDVVNLASIGADTITALFTGIAPSNPNTSCVGEATLTGVGGNQAKAPGALYSQYPAQTGGSIRGGIFGTVAVQRGFLGLTTRQLRQYGTQITILPIFNQSQIAQLGGPTGGLSVSDYGDQGVQATSGVAFDIYRFPTVSAGMQFGRQENQFVGISFPTASGGSCPAGFVQVP